MAWLVIKPQDPGHSGPLCPNHTVQGRSIQSVSRHGTHSSHLVSGEQTRVLRSPSLGHPPALTLPVLRDRNLRPACLGQLWAVPSFGVLGCLSTGNREVGCREGGCSTQAQLPSPISTPSPWPRSTKGLNWASVCPGTPSTQPAMCASPSSPQSWSQSGWRSHLGPTLCRHSPRPRDMEQGSSWASFRAQHGGTLVSVETY